jgi:alpha-tubulin suppressor-like RCC1 family protein
LVFEPWALDAGGTRTLLLTGDGTLWIWGKPLGPEDAGLGAKVEKVDQYGRHESGAETTL